MKPWMFWCNINSVIQSLLVQYCLLIAHSKQLISYFIQKILSDIRKVDYINVIQKLIIYIGYYKSKSKVYKVWTILDNIKI